MGGACRMDGERCSSPDSREGPSWEARFRNSYPRGSRNRRNGVRAWGEPEKRQPRRRRGLSWTNPSTMQHQDTLPAALRGSFTWLFALALLLVLSAAPALAAQKKNDGANCPYCKGDTTIMEKAKLVNHGGFEFGINDTAKIDAYLAAADIRWLESEHFQIGLA